MSQPESMTHYFPSVTTETLIRDEKSRNLFNQGISDVDRDTVDLSCFDDAYLAGVLYAKEHHLLRS